MDEWVDPIREAEERLKVLLLGRSTAVTAAQAKTALRGALAELDGAGSGYGVGFAFVRGLGQVKGDGIQCLFVLTDGTRSACMRVEVSGRQIHLLGYPSGQRYPSDPDETLQAWMRRRLYRIAGAVPRGMRYEGLLIPRVHNIDGED
jgi:hypothetical protein